MRNSVSRDRCTMCVQCVHCCATPRTAEDARRSPGRGQPVCTLSARYIPTDSVVLRDWSSVWVGTTKKKLNQKQQIGLDDYIPNRIKKYLYYTDRKTEMEGESRQTVAAAPPIYYIRRILVTNYI